VRINSEQLYLLAKSINLKSCSPTETFETSSSSSSEIRFTKQQFHFNVHASHKILDHALFKDNIKINTAFLTICWRKIRIKLPQVAMEDFIGDINIEHVSALQYIIHGTVINCIKALSVIKFSIIQLKFPSTPTPCKQV
jgi:hypothetical protein